MPGMRFIDIVNSVKSITNVTNQDTLIKRAIQRGLYKATMFNLPYLMEETYIATVAPYETGTVSITNGSATVTGSGTTFTSAMVGRKIRFNGENAYYRISAYVAADEITLETTYKGTDDTDATFSIYKDEYRLPPDLDSYKVMRQIEDSKAMLSLEASAFDMLNASPNSSGSPSYDILAGSKMDVYTTGTVSGTISTNTITGASTAWTSVEGLGRGSKIRVGSYIYTVKSVDSATQITTYEALVSAIAALSTYEIKLDNLIVQFYTLPDEAENIYFRYQRIPYPLENDYDIPDLPYQYHHILVTAGSIWAWITKDKEESIRQEGIFSNEVREMWSRISNISKSRRYPRVSQDGRLEAYPIWPMSYGRPFSI